MASHWNPNLACPGDTPLGIEVQSAQGIYIRTTDGKSYMDLIAGLSVANIGHRHPKVMEAIHAQMDQYLHVMVFGEYIQKPQNRFASLLAEVLPPQLNCTYFTNSGTEANEGALKLAKRHTGRTRIIAFKGAYHGSTHGALSVGGNEQKKYAFRPLLPDVHHLEFNATDQLNAIDETVAAVIIEPIQGDAGIRIPEKSYMQALRARCTATDTPLIFDEVQTGFGRTGRLFAFEHFDVVPDILTLGKALGGGLAMGAFISSREKMADLQSKPMLGHITSFGGHPLCCAAGHASLKAILEEKMLEEVASKGAYLKKMLEPHPVVVEIRQIGLFMAVEMESAQKVNDAVQAFLKQRVIGFYFLSCRNSFRLAPPINITRKELKEAALRLLKALNTLN